MASAERVPRDREGKYFAEEPQPYLKGAAQGEGVLLDVSAAYTGRSTGSV